MILIHPYSQQSFELQIENREYPAMRFRWCKPKTRPCRMERKRVVNTMSICVQHLLWMVHFIYPYLSIMSLRLAVKLKYYCYRTLYCGGDAINWTFVGECLTFYLCNHWNDRATKSTNECGHIHCYHRFCEHRPNPWQRKWYRQPSQQFTSSILQKESTQKSAKQSTWNHHPFRMLGKRNWREKNKRKYKMKLWFSRMKLVVQLFWQ